MRMTITFEAVLVAVIAACSGPAQPDLRTPPASVASITISPPSVSAQAGSSVQLGATALDSAGNVLANRTVAWSSSDTAVAQVSSTGMVSARKAGGANIHAAVGGRGADAPVTVTAAPPPPPPPPPAPVATVTVSLASASLTVGQTTQATAVLKDASGNVLTGRAVSWSTSNAAVATVSSSGVVNAVAAGSANIGATSEGKTGSATVTVTVVTGKIDTLFTDHFETGALGDAGRWHDIVGTGASIVSAAAEGVTAPSGTKLLKLAPSGVALSHFVSTAATSPYERLYLSFQMYRTSAYQSANNGLRAGGIRGSTTQWGSFGVGWGTPGSCPDDPNNVTKQEFMFAYVFQDGAAWALRTYTNWLGQLKLSQSPPTCGGGYAIAAGNNPQATYHDINFAPTVNAWHRYEIEVQLNTVGQADGWQRMWVDGVLKIEHLNVRYRTTTGMKLWAVTIDTGNIPGGALYVDDVLVTSRRP